MFARFMNRISAMASKAMAPKDLGVLYWKGLKIATPVAVGYSIYSEFSESHYKYKYYRQRADMQRISCDALFAAWASIFYPVCLPLAVIYANVWATRKIYDIYYADANDDSDCVNNDCVNNDGINNDGVNNDSVNNDGCVNDGFGFKEDYDDDVNNNGFGFDGGYAPPFAPSASAPSAPSTQSPKRTLAIIAIEHKYENDAKFRKYVDDYKSDGDDTETTPDSTDA